MDILSVISVLLIICLVVYLFSVVYGMEKEDMHKEEIQKLRDNEDLKL